MHDTQASGNFFTGTLPAGLVWRDIDRFLEHLDDILFLFDREGVCLACCTRTPELLFAPTEQFIGRRMEDYLTPELAVSVRERLIAHLRGQSLPPLSYAAPDRKSWYELDFIALPGSPDYPLARIQHVTEQRLFAQVLS